MFPLFKGMMLNVFSFSKGTPIRGSIKKLANFTSRDIVLETFLKSPLRMRLEKSFSFPVISGKNTLIVRGKLLKRRGLVSNIMSNNKVRLNCHALLLRLIALQFFSRRRVKASAINVPVMQSLGELHQGGFLSGLKTQEALVKGYPCHKLASNISLNKGLIKMHYETYSQI